jgi:hypothetical protein
MNPEDCALARVLDQREFCAVFHSRNSARRNQDEARIGQITRKSLGWAVALALRHFRSAPILLHTPVDQLHSTEFKAHTVLFFRLTAPKEGVKPYSFFDSF